MDSLYVKAILAGIFFGAYPLLLNRSGLTGNLPVFIFSFIILIFIFPFVSFEDERSIFSANWIMIIGAGILGSVAMLLFNRIIVAASPWNMSLLFVLMLIAQIVVQGVYQTALGGITITKGIGFLFAVAAAVLLLI